jgi:RPA family protein
VKELSSSQPKAKFYTRINEQGYLNLVVWSGKADPTAEVIVADIRQKNGEKWETVGKIAVYRTSDGSYTQLPERK